MTKLAEDLHPDYDIGFDEGRVCGYQQACNDLTRGEVAHSIINALRRAGRTMQACIIHSQLMHRSGPAQSGPIPCLKA